MVLVGVSMALAAASVALAAAPGAGTAWRLDGDFTGDGRTDALHATLGEASLRLVAHDGAERTLALPGRLTAVAAGELHRADGLADFALAVDGIEGAALLLYQGPRGAWVASPQRIALDAPADQLVIARLDPDVSGDVVVASGNMLRAWRGGDQFLHAGSWTELPSPAHGGLVQRLSLADGAVHVDGVAARHRLAWNGAGLMLAPVGPQVARAKGEAIAFTVNAADDIDDGGCTVAHCSLREALLAANGNASFLNTIEFAIPAGPGIVPTIAPTSALPVVTAPVLIDGRSQAAGLVEISGINRAAADPVEDGLVLAGSGSTVRGLVINRFNAAQLRIAGNSVSVLGNRIGTSIDGNQPLGGGDYQPAVLVQGSNAVVGSAAGTTPGGACTGDCNLIAGSFYGMQLATGSSATVQGNFFSVSVGGGMRLAGSGKCIDARGLLVLGGPGEGEGNVLASNESDTVDLHSGSAGSIVQGNRIGTDSTGTVVLGNAGDGLGVYVSDVLIGGTAGVTPGGRCTGACNVISGGFNAWAQGIEINGSARRTVVQGNHIGVDVTGLVALGNDGGGILVREDPALVGGSAPGAGNVAGGNSRYGIAISDGTSEGAIRILGNRVGVGVDDVTPLPNGLGTGENAGVHVAGQGEMEVGGIGSGEGNTIAFNTRGVVYGSYGTDPPHVRGNAIYDNDGLGLDLYDDGLTANGDADSIDYTNVPLLDTVVTQASQTSVSGLVSMPSAEGGVLDFYTDLACDGSGSGEGAVYVGSAAVAAGAGAFAVVLPVGVPVGGVLTATASTAGNGTSEFSTCATVETTEPADLALALSASSATVAPGAVVSYTMSVQHLSGPTLSDATATLAMPAGSVFVSASGASCSAMPGVVTCPLPVLAEGNWALVVVDVQLPPALADGDQLTATATVSSFVQDPTPANNAQSVTVDVDALHIFADSFED